ncbi:hypothetical protein DFQ28_003709 [Apophysomyces sp. BC1034]|nr:hypothetical protein DFQ30_003727 [Apophysomyces sp. BC1015]KAG0178905.1 hypothetical protein DFQ29_002860 [Apophysomyces sp. BC1021]KAG0189216.1 hypothetical protein DFQ28_003709 [Apophysomyces sp. BC1034]
MSSVSWMAEKSANELIPMLKNAYSTLKDKEKDLVLAAEIGKKLLENNKELKSSYENLLQQAQAPVPIPLPTPSSSLVTVCDTIPDESDSGIDSAQESDDDGHSDMRLIPSRGTREAMIEELERKNMELSKRLETLGNEQGATDRFHVKKVRKLQSEIDALKSSLENATAKIEELEEITERQKLSIPVAENDTENEKIVENLLSTVNKLETENSKISQSKAALEQKLLETFKDLRSLKSEFERFQFTQKDHEELQEAYDRQFQHIAELNESLEEHRILLQELKERGVNLHSARSTPAPSTYDDNSGEPFRHTLLGELENEWIKRNQHPPSPPKLKTSKSTPVPRTTARCASEYSFRSLTSLSHLTEKSLAAIYNVPTTESELMEMALSKASGLDKSLLDEALSLISRMEEEHEAEKAACVLADEDNKFSLFDDGSFPSYGLYPKPVKSESSTTEKIAPSTFLGRLRRLLLQLFQAVWRWCRFAMVLIMAVIISLWQGPEKMF